MIELRRARARAKTKAKAIAKRMDATNLRIAKRVATYMLEVSEQQVDLSFFMGLGLSLAIIYEEITGQSANSIKPQDLMLWALDLPTVRFPHVKG